MKKLIIFSIFSIWIISCDWDTRLNLFSHSKKKLRYTWEIMDISDTILDDSFCEKTNPYELLPLEENNLRLQSRWDLNLNKPNKVLRIFIFDEDTLNKYGTCKVYRNYLFRKRIDLTYDDLIKLNWKIDYYDK